MLVTVSGIVLCSVSVSTILTAESVSVVGTFGFSLIIPKLLPNFKSTKNSAAVETASPAIIVSLFVFTLSPPY